MAFNIWDWDKNPSLSGKLVMKKSNMPPYGKKIYGFELENGEVWYAWGTYVLVGQLAPLPFMTDVKIRYLGMGPEKPDDKYNKKLFDVVVVNLPDKSKKAAKLEKKLKTLKTK